jgi:hypothetical protein
MKCTPFVGNIAMYTVLDTHMALYCHVYQRLKMGFGLVIGFIGYLQVVATNNCNTVTDFHTTEHSTLLSLVYLH